MASLWLDAESQASPGASLSPPGWGVRTTLPGPVSQGQGLRLSAWAAEQAGPMSSGYVGHVNQTHGCRRNTCVWD